MHVLLDSKLDLKDLSLVFVLGIVILHGVQNPKKGKKMSDIEIWLIWKLTYLAFRKSKNQNLVNSSCWEISILLVYVVNLAR